jgi:hypothetical protein
MPIRKLVNICGSEAPRSLSTNMVTEFAILIDMPERNAVTGKSSITITHWPTASLQRKNRCPHDDVSTVKNLTADGSMSSILTRLTFSIFTEGNVLVKVLV